MENMNKKLIVWDLFGGGVNRTYNALKDDKDVEILTFDLYPEKAHKNQYIVDLSQDFDKLREFFW